MNYIFEFIALNFTLLIGILFIIFFILFIFLQTRYIINEYKTIKKIRNILFIIFLLSILHDIYGA